MLATPLPLFLLLVLLCALSSGCVPHGAAIPVGEAPAASDPARVMLFASGTPPHAYTMVGFVSADGSDAQEALNELRDQAASLGANGVVALDIELYGASRVLARGAAVVFA